MTTNPTDEKRTEKNFEPFSPVRLRAVANLPNTTSQANVYFMPTLKPPRQCFSVAVATGSSSAVTAVFTFLPPFQRVRALLLLNPSTAQPVNFASASIQPIALALFRLVFLLKSITPSPLFHFGSTSFQHTNSPSGAFICFLRRSFIYALLLLCAFICFCTLYAFACAFTCF